MSDDEYQSSRGNYSRGYEDDLKKQYSERYEKGSRQPYSDSKSRSYNENQRFYREEQRGYGYRDSEFSDENKKNYNGDSFYRSSSRNDGFRRSNDYYPKNENSYYKVSDLDYISKKNYGYDEYNKKPKIESRNSISQESFYNKELPYSKPYKTKHIPAEPNCTIGVFGFNPNTTDEDLKNLLIEKLPTISNYTHKLIMDERTLQCKGYCFINFKCLNDAITAKSILNLESYRGQDFKCDYSYKQGLLGD